MAWYNFLKKNQDEKITETKSDVFVGSSDYNYNPIIDSIWDGEKTPGELGAVYDTLPDYLKLRLRAYDMNLKTDLIKIITGKFFKWVIGTGLKLQAEPNQVVLELSGIKEDLPIFQKNVENLFGLYASSKYGDFHKKDDLHQKASDAFQTAFLGGDVLCVIRFDNFGPNIQVIDGQQVENPFDDKKKKEGNVIKNGIELNKKGEHVAFWIAVSKENALIEHERVEAKNSNGNLVAWMIYGDKARIDHHRGIPRISSILEKTAKLDRFVEASVSKAEQTANVVYAFKHNTNSTGENIIKTSLSSKVNQDESTESAYEKSGRTANMLRQSTAGTVLNLTPDSDLISLYSESETSFENFFRAVFVSLCASVDIPEEVALQKYEQNYSSSRAAINMWEHIVEIYRVKFSQKFYQPFYNVWLEYQVLTDKIKLNGFLKSKKVGDFMAMEAYYNARFLGKKMPHIDPLKEAKAIRSLLGESKAPLISHEQATELMNGGNWDENFKKYLEEVKLIPEQKDDKDENNKQNTGLESKSEK